MRIGIEVLGTQSVSRFRGIGRYVHEFTSELLKTESPHEFVVYAQADAPTDYLPEIPSRVPLRFLKPIAERGERDLTGAFRRVLAANPDRLDVILITNPLELREDFLTPAKPLNGLKVASIVHDLIPLIFRDHYYTAWNGPEYARRYHRGLDRLRTYDLLLSNSEATREDCIRLLGIPAAKIRTILAASESDVWRPASPDTAASDQRVIQSLGVVGKFVFSLGSMEYRKKILELIDAFSRLGAAASDSRQLVLTYALSPAEETAVRAHATKAGVLDRIVITPRLSDGQLAALYRQCDTFVFPSIYEGFGFPVLEALRCGAPVVTGKNSSLTEVVGNAGLLIDIGDVQAMTRSLKVLKEDPEEVARLRSLAPIQARKFTWRSTAESALQAFESLRAARPRIRVDRPSGRVTGKKRIAYFSPFPPLLSGISDYSERLVQELRRDYVVDVYHDAGYEPNLKVRSLDHACHDYRLFRRNDAILHYDSIIYQMGNSGHHRFMYDLMKSYPGIVTLHDFNLAGFRYWNAMNHEGGIDAFRRELADFSPRLAAKLDPVLTRFRDDQKMILDACAEAGAFMNQAVFRHASDVVVHSPWCLRRAREIHGNLADKGHVILYGATVRRRSTEERNQIRARYGLAPDAFIVGNFGIIHQTKMNVESVRAFADVAKLRSDAMFILVGPEYDGGAVRREVELLGLEDRVRFLGPRPASEFVELTACADLGLNLRRPPSNGETSSSLLDLLRQGIPSVITDVGTFDDFPDQAAAKVRWKTEGFEGLRKTVVELAQNEKRRRELGEAAAAYVEKEHGWTEATRRYAGLIEGRERIQIETRSSQAVSTPHFRTLPARTQPKKG